MRSHKARVKPVLYEALRQVNRSMVALRASELIRHDSVTREAAVVAAHVHVETAVACLRHVIGGSDGAT